MRTTPTSTVSPVTVAAERPTMAAAPPTPPARAGVAIYAAVTAALFALHLVLSRSMDGFLLADGTGYLANARWLVGEAGSTWQGPAAFYNAGWSIVMAPVYLFTSSPDAVHVAVLIVNALLASLSFVAYAALAEIGFGLGRRTAVLAGVVAATYPAVLLQASFEWSESLFHLLFPVLLLAILRLLRTTTALAAVGAALAAAALNLTHPKGLGPLAALAVAFAVLGVRRAVPRSTMVAGLATIAIAFVATRVLHGALQDAMYDRSAAAIEGDVLGRITDPKLVWGAFRAFWGQLWYLTVATVGLFPLGIAALVGHRDRRFAGITMGTALAVLAASCLQMSDGTRVDHMVYGRYDEGFVPALLVAAVAGLVVHRQRVLRLLPIAAGIAAVSGVLTVVLNGGEKFAGNVMPLNVVGVLVYRTAENHIDVLVVTLLASIPLVALAFAARQSLHLALSLVVVFFVASSLSVEARTIRPFEDFWSSVTEIPEVVHDIGFEGPIGYDLAAYEVEAADLYQLELTDVGGLLFFDSRTSEHLPGSDLVIASPTWDLPGARLLFVETGPYPQALWVLPGDLQDELDASGAVLPAEHSAPLPDATQAATLTAERDGDRLTVHVRDDGGTWLPVGPIRGLVDGTVRLGSRWYVGDDIVAADTVELPRVLRKDDDVELELPIADLDAGTYDVVVSLRQEGIAWWDASAVRLRITLP